jgi:hypothetical protein
MVYFCGNFPVVSHSPAWGFLNHPAASLPLCIEMQQGGLKRQWRRKEVVRNKEIKGK